MRKKEEQALSFRKKLLGASIAFLFLVLLIASFFGERGLIQLYRVQQKKLALEERVQELTDQKQRLIREISELSTNPYAFETKAREKLMLLYPDEKVIIK